MHRYEEIRALLARVRRRWRAQRAFQATVRVAKEDGALVVEVGDDGVGGARASTGSGLSGLADRVDAVDGTLSVVSPSGQGTVVRAVLPLEVA